MLENDNIITQEVVDSVLREVKTLGDNTKKNFEELRSNYLKLKEIVDREGGDQYDKNYIDKLSTDITTRQEELDKKNKELQDAVKEKIEALEASINRPGVGSSDVPKEVQENYEKFIVNAMGSREKGTSVYELNRQKETFGIEEYKKYHDALVKLWRCRDDKSALSPEEWKTLSVGVDPHGGYTVTPAVSNRVIQRLFETDPMRQLCSIENITTAELDFYVDWDDSVSTGWETETAGGSETPTPQVPGMKKIPVYTAYAKTRSTMQFLEDAGINVETWLANKIAEKWMRTESAGFITGDGIGKPRGILTYSNGTTKNTIEQVNMGAAAALTADGFIDVKYSLIEYYLNRGTWLMNRLTVAAAMKLKYGDGEYIWKPGITADQQSTILNLPVRMSTTMPTVAANALSVVLADFRTAYVIVDRLGITTQRDPYTAKPFVEFYSRKRVGGDIVNTQAIKIGKIAA